MCVVMVPPIFARISQWINSLVLARDILSCGLTQTGQNHVFGMQENHLGTVQSPWSIQTLTSMVLSATITLAKWFLHSYGILMLRKVRSHITDQVTGATTI
uniref:Uncharacterized protein n=1 Tax=Sphaerodactylus townsendi TaxID=933632 RepID=A0ACB8FIS1_9SAUR